MMGSIVPAGICGSFGNSLLGFTAFGFFSGLFLSAFLFAFLSAFLLAFLSARLLDPEPLRWQR
jgi:hypothetical protein